MREIKYRAQIGGEFFYFDLNDLGRLASIDWTREYHYQKIISFLKANNQPDIFTGLQDINKIDIYENDILNLHPYFGDKECYHPGNIVIIKHDVHMFKLEFIGGNKFEFNP